MTIQSLGSNTFLRSLYVHFLGAYSDQWIYAFVLTKRKINYSFLWLNFKQSIYMEDEVKD
jgi:hypothetical protein